jgi:acyl-CoA dehydrogenase
MIVADALAVLRERGPDRAAEMAVLGEWLLAQAGLRGDDGEVTVAPGSVRDSLEVRGGRLSGSVHRVPWARDAARIAILLDGRVLVIERADVSIEEHVNLAGEARDTVVFDGAVARSGPGVDAEALFLRGASMRIALMAGALDALYEIVVRHAGERHQFGRPIGAFQAVQQHLVTIAQQVALAGVAAQATAQRPGAFEIAAGKLLANHAALSAGRAAHQVLGARGLASSRAGSGPGVRSTVTSTTGAPGSGRVSRVRARTACTRRSRAVRLW